MQNLIYEHYQKNNSVFLNAVVAVHFLQNKLLNEFHEENVHLIQMFLQYHSLYLINLLIILLCAHCTVRVRPFPFVYHKSWYSHFSHYYWYYKHFYSCFWFAFPVFFQLSFLSFCFCRSPLNLIFHCLFSYCPAPPRPFLLLWRRSALLPPAPIPPLKWVFGSKTNAWDWKAYK